MENHTLSQTARVCRLWSPFAVEVIWSRTTATLFRSFKRSPALLGIIPLFLPWPENLQAQNMVKKRSTRATAAEIKKSSNEVISEDEIFLKIVPREMDVKRQPLVVTNKAFNRFLIYVHCVRSLDLGDPPKIDPFLHHAIVSFLTRLSQLSQLAEPFNRLHTLSVEISPENPGTVPSHVILPLLVTSSLRHLFFLFQGGSKQHDDLMRLLRHLMVVTPSLETLNIKMLEWQTDDNTETVEQSQLLKTVVLSQRSIKSLTTPAVLPMVGALENLLHLECLELDLTSDQVTSDTWSSERLTLPKLKKLALVSTTDVQGGILLLENGAFPSLQHIIFSNSLDTLRIAEVLAKRYTRVLRITVRGERGPRMLDMEAFQGTINMAHLHELNFVLGWLGPYGWTGLTPAVIKQILRSLPNLKTFRLRQPKLLEPHCRMYGTVDLSLACLQYSGENLETLDISLYIMQRFTLPPVPPFILPSLRQLSLSFSSFEENLTGLCLELLLVCLPSECNVSATKDSGDDSLDQRWMKLISRYNTERWRARSNGR